MLYVYDMLTSARLTTGRSEFAAAIEVRIESRADYCVNDVLASGVRADEGNGGLVLGQVLVAKRTRVGGRERARFAHIVQTHLNKYLKLLDENKFE